MSIEMHSQALAGEVIDVAVGEVLPAPGSLLGAALAVANSQGAPATRETYAATYRKFARDLHVRLGREPRIDDFTREALQAYRDGLEREGRASATIAKDLSGLRRLAVELELDERIQRVKAGASKQKQPRPLTREQLEVLFRAPDARTRLGKRDRAMLYLMAFAGLRRREVVLLRHDDIEQVRRNDRPDRRGAVAQRAGEQSAFRVRVEGTKRGAHRTVDLHRDVAKALAEWLRARPPAATDRVFVSLDARAGELSVRAVNRMMARYADKALLPADRRTPHVLRHSFCTLLVENDQSIDLIAELAGHKDVRTTRIYTAISDERRRRAIDETFDAPTGAQLLAGTEMGGEKDAA